MTRTETTSDPTSDPAPPKPKRTGRDRILYWFLLFFAANVSCALLAAAMPRSAMVSVAAFFRIDDFPEGPLTEYLARHLSVLYGLCGLFMFLLASDLQRYRPLIVAVGWAVVALGVLQACVDVHVGMPRGWTWGESISTSLGGLILVWLAK